MFKTLPKTPNFQDEIENMKELLHTCETSLARKDAVISNLTRALQTSKERQEMMKALSTWKLRLNDERRQVSEKSIFDLLPKIFPVT